MRRIACPLLYLLLLLFSSTTPVSAEETMVMAFSDFPPYKMRIAGEHAGIDVELAKRIAEKMELALEFRDCDFNECLELMRTGQADLMTSLLRRPEREEYIHYVQPRYYSHNIKALYVTKDGGRSIVQYGDLQGLRIGVKQGARYVPMFDEDKDLNKVEAPTVPQLLRMLLAGKLDTVIANETEGAFWIKAMGLGGELGKASFAFEQLDPVYMGLSKQSPLAKRSREFGKALKSLVDRGVFEEQRQEYMKRAEELADQLQ